MTNPRVGPTRSTTNTTSTSGPFLALRQTFESSTNNLVDTVETFPPDLTENPARAITNVGNTIMGALQLPLDMANAAVAEATNFLSDMWPKFPAAQFGSLYVGLPHGHEHPPSFGIPLPSIGVVLIGTYLKVHVGGLPAARAGDLGIAPTCLGLMPFFEVKLGSSKVFIGGARAGRVTDLCMPCTVDPMQGLEFMQVAGMALQAVDIVADLVDASKNDAAQPAAAPAPATQQQPQSGSGPEQDEVAALQSAAAALAAQIAAAQEPEDAAGGEAAPDPNLGEAQAYRAMMNALQLLSDAAAMAVRLLMGKDPAVPPLPGFLLTGAFNVLVAGIPFPTIPDPLQLLLKSLKAKAKKMRERKKPQAEHENEEHVGGCSTCKR